MEKKRESRRVLIILTLAAMVDYLNNLVLSATAIALPALLRRLTSRCSPTTLVRSSCEVQFTDFDSSDLCVHNTSMEGARASSLLRSERWTFTASTPNAGTRTCSAFAAPNCLEQLMLSRSRRPALQTPSAFSGFREPTASKAMA